MKKLIALLMAIAMLASMVACGDDEKQEDVLDTNNPILNASANLFSKLADEGGTITLSAEGEIIDLLEENLDFTFENLEFAMAPSQVQATLNGKLGKTELSESIYYGNQNVVVNSPNLLGGAYGIDLGTLTEDFEDSVFHPDSDSDYCIDEDALDELEEAIEMLEEMMNGEAGEMIPGINIEEMSATITAVIETFVEELKEIYPVESSTDDDGFSVESITVTSDKLDEVFDLLADTLESKDVQDMLESINDTMDEYAGQEIPFDMLPDLLREASDELMRELDDAEISCTASVKTSKDGMETIISMIMDIEFEGEEGSIGFILTDKVSDDSDEFVHTMSLNYVFGGVIEDLFESGDLFGSNSEYGEDYGSYDSYYVTKANNVSDILTSLLESGIEIKTEWDKKKGDINVSVDLGNQEMFALEGNLQLSNNEMTFEFEDIEIAGTSVTKGMIDNVTLKITAGKPKGLSTPKFTNILGVDEDDIEDLIDDLEDAVEDLGLGMFGGAIGGYDDSFDDYYSDTPSYDYDYDF